MKKIEIELREKTYPIFIGAGILRNFDKIIDASFKNERIAVAADKRVVKLHRQKLLPLINMKKRKAEVFLFDASEKNKNLAGISKIYSFLQERNYGRDSLIVSAGGGITGDTAAFAASTYMRGIKYVNIPTTLLSAVDSSIGGKTGVNFNGIKNFIGTFYHPEFVIIDTEFFATLPADEIICGLGELVKTAFLAGGKFYNSLYNSIEEIAGGNFKGIENIIYDAVSFKAGVVASDEKEKGLRKILNLGHTFAHAVEKESGFAVKHGQAVIFGIVAALSLSKNMALVTARDYASELEFIGKIKKKIKVPLISPEILYDAMLSDKKNRSGRIKFVLPGMPGNAVIDAEADKKQVLKAIVTAYNYFK